MAAIKALTISQVEQSKDSSVWVVNATGSAGNPKGIMNVTIVEGNGRSSTIRIPVTFIAVDLTTQATKSALLMSPDFRRIVSAGLLTLISEEDAQGLNNNEEARKENRRLMNVDSVHEVQESQQSTQVKSVLAEAAGDVGGLAMSIAHTTDGDEDTVLSNVRNNLESLSQKELQYIVNNSTFHKVKALAAEHIVR